MKQRCKHCGDYFTLTKEDQELCENGAQLPEICEECFLIQEDSLRMPEENFSDADPGL